VPGEAANGETNNVRNWVLEARYRPGWQTEILPAPQTSFNFREQPEAVVLRAADRLGNLSRPSGMVGTKPIAPTLAGHRG
jgi:hypothetical protein